MSEIQDVKELLELLYMLYVFIYTYMFLHVYVYIYTENIACCHRSPKQRSATFVALHLQEQRMNGARKTARFTCAMRAAAALRVEGYGANHARPSLGLGTLGAFVEHWSRSCRMEANLSWKKLNFSIVMEKVKLWKYFEFIISIAYFRFY